MSQKFRGDALGKLLMEEGVVPKHTSNVELHISATGALTLHYDVYVTDEDIPKIQRALGKLLESD